MLVAATIVVALPAFVLAVPAHGGGESKGPLVTVVRHGGLCFRGRDRPGVECRVEIRIGDRSMSAGLLSRRLTRGERAGLLRAIAELDLRSIRAHPFRGTCPIAYDGMESIYVFRGFPHRLRSCTYDLRRVKAVRLTDRLIASLGVP